MILNPRVARLRIVQETKHISSSYTSGKGSKAQNVSNQAAKTACTYLVLCHHMPLSPKRNGYIASIEHAQILAEHGLASSAKRLPDLHLIPYFGPKTTRTKPQEPHSTQQGTPWTQASQPPSWSDARGRWPKRCRGAMQSTGPAGSAGCWCFRPPKPSKMQMLPSA